MYNYKQKTPLVGHVDGEQHFIENTTEQICAFIMENRLKNVLITDVFDVFVLNTLIGFIDTCPNQQFLREELLPKLIPMQTGQVKPPKFVPVVLKEVMKYISFQGGKSHV